MLQDERRNHSALDAEADQSIEAAAAFPREPALDPVASPWGAYALSPTIAALRAASIGLKGAPLIGRWAYKIFSHLANKPGAWYDVDYRGSRFRLAPLENAADRAILRRGRHPEEADFELFDDLWRDDPVFVDIGANMGLYTLIGAGRLPETARLLAIEPHPRTFRRLSFHLAVNAVANATAVQAAVGDTEAKLPIYAPRASNAGENTLVGHEGATPVAVVSVRLLAALLAEAGLDRIDLLKIDVEGFEDRALTPFFDAAPEAAWPRRIVLETAHRKAWSTDLIGRLKDLGYSAGPQRAGNTIFRRAPT